jgi:carboxypeptidase-like protein
MRSPKLLQRISIAVLFVMLSEIAIGQETISGTIYDSSQRYPMPGVSVMGTSGGGTITDSLGHYIIKLRAEDSIYFSYLGKATAKFPVKDIASGQPFDMSLQVTITSLPGVTVWPRDYGLDSLENRREYQRIFDYGGAGYVENTKMTRKGTMGVGFDLDMFFKPGEERRMLAFQQRLISEEQDKFVDHRFTKAIVKKITGLQPPALDSFMRIYKPSFEFLKSFETEYQFYKYISDCGKNFSEMWKEEHPDLQEKQVK